MNKLWTSAPTQHTIDRMEGVKDSSYAIEPGDVKFLIRLCSQLYREDRLTGSQMRDMAQRLDNMIDQAEAME